MANNYEKLDHWSLKAKKEGYPARSVYKLKEMDEKFDLLKPGNGHGGGHGTEAGFRVLDLGAAPGSWSLYALRKFALPGSKQVQGETGNGAALVAADLSPLSRQYDRGLFDGNNFFFIQGDLTAPGARENILARGPYNLVMSDAAPSTTGNRSVDTLRSLELAEAVLSYAETALASGGNLIVKVFQGGDTSNILRRIRELFTNGKAFKPSACRNESFETYYLGLGKKSGR
jgi:23S rRNA (uridine2552-2'-O)-methyltransferase